MKTSLTRSLRIALILQTVMAGLLLNLAGPAMAEAAPSNAERKHQYETAQDQREIRQHVESIFNAFIDQDYEKVRNTHTVDWRGFRNGTRSMIRGIDGYMSGLGRGSADPAVGFEFLDFDVEVEGDLASVLYLARYFRSDSKTDEIYTYLLRSIDTYRRDPNGWNQSGSNICVLLDDPPRTPSLQELEDFGLAIKRGRDSDEDAGAMFEDSDPSIRTLAESVVASIQHGDDETLRSLVTDDWNAYGASSLSRTTAATEGAELVKTLSGGATFQDLELIELATDVRGDAATAFYAAEGKARFEPDGTEFNVQFRFGDLLRREVGQWRLRSSHMSIVFLDSGNHF